MRSELNFLINTAVRRINRSCDCGSKMDIKLHSTFIYRGSIVRNVPYLTCPSCGIQEDIDTVLFAIQEEQDSHLYKSKTINIHIDRKAI